MPRSRSLPPPFATAVVPLVVALAALGAKKPDPQRAKPPTFSPAEEATFFEDAFTQLAGPRPDFSAAAPPPVVASGGGAEPAGGGEFAWSRWVSTSTLESEIKRQTLVVAEQVASATAFKSGGYRKCRDAFSTLAVMFAISANHDEDARWRDIADGMATLVARAGANCKVGTDNTFREAKARGEDLSGLVRGNRPEVPRPDEDRDNWGRLADRGPLMKRMELALQDRLGPLSASERTFKRGAEDALHEAQVLAALSEVLTREGFDDAGDEDYDAFSRALRDAAADLARAAEQEDYTTVREAYGRAGKACSDCHEYYRG